ncbi:HAD family hydrolase [Vibrio diabolicus]|uniref:HAD family hydrolase n=1 Tax=Vibrio diabolicus TaxID=50719 RepID=UPI002940CE46|nr:HAD-IA family hydrolase [Vibrio diabolicus]MDV5032997.1 HAD-IA family hydrolase [Vibrio diabolicus]
MKGNIDSIIFDAGGVLMFIKEFRSSIIERVLLAKGYDISLIDRALADLQIFDREFFAKSKIVDWSDEKQWLQERALRISNFVNGDNLLAEQLFHVALDTHQYQLYSETVEVLEQLREKYRLFVLSNATATLDWAFDSLGIRQYFEQVMISSYVGCEKPNREIYVHALSSFSLNPSSTMFIDDKVENVVAAKSCGIQAYHLQRSKSENLSSFAELLVASSKPYL